MGRVDLRGNYEDFHREEFHYWIKRPEKNFLTR